MKLYELAAEYQNFLDAVEDGLIPEEALIDTLDSITTAIEDKADNIASMLKSMAADIIAIRNEENALAERRNSIEKRYKSIEGYLSTTLLNSGLKKVETARNKITFRKSDGVVFDDEKRFIEWAMHNGRDDLLTFKDPSVNRTIIKKYLKDGQEIAGARIENRENIQIK